MAIEFFALPSSLFPLHSSLFVLPASLIKVSAFFTFKKMSQHKDFTLRLVAGANIVTIIIMLLLGYSDREDAAAHPVIGVIGLAFPVFLVLNILFLLFWLCVRKRGAVIPFLGLIMGYGPIST